MGVISVCYFFFFFYETDYLRGICVASVLCLFTVIQPSLGIIGVLSEGKGPRFNKSIGEHTRYGIHWQVGNTRQIQMDFKFLKVQFEQKRQEVGSGVLASV